MLNFLTNSTRPEAKFAVHRCTRFSADPKLPHNQAVNHVINYLKGTSDQGVIINPNTEKGVEFYVDSEFSGGLNQEEGRYPGLVLYRAGYIISYSNCLIIWVRRLQTEISIGTTEAEYIVLSRNMRDILPFVRLMKEF